MIGILSVARGEGGGAESVLEHLLQAWPDPAELMLVAVEGSRTYRMATRVGIRTHALRSDRDTLGSNLIGVTRLLPTLHSCGVIHGWSSRAFELAVFAGHLTGAIVSGTQHDHPAAEYVSGRRQRLMRWAANRFARLVCVSQAVTNACREARYGAPFTVIPNGLCDLGFVSPQSSPVRVGFLGMHDPDKGFSVIGPWVERLLARTGVEFELYGEVAPALRAAAGRLVDKAPDRVRLRGWRPAAEVYREIDVLVHASLKFETFGMVLAEAACAGIPVVASVRGAEAEVVTHGESGFLFSADRPEEGMARLEQLIHDPALRQHMGRQARACYEARFTAVRMAADYRSFWRDLAIDFDVPVR